MGHPLIDEFCRAGELRPGYLRRFQRELRDQIEPLLNEREALLEENANLKRLLQEGNALLEEQAELKTKRRSLKGVADVSA